MNVLETIYELRARAIARGGAPRLGWRRLMAKRPMQEWRAIADHLERTGRPWATMGAVATRGYRPERTTDDIDILVRLEDRGKFHDALRAAGFARDRDLDFPHQPRWSGTAWNRSADGMDLDLISIDMPWVEAALTEAASIRDPEGLRVLPMPYLVLTKIESMRGKDVTDLSEVLGVALRRGESAAIDRARELVRCNFPHLEDDFETLLQLGEWEIGPE